MKSKLSWKGTNVYNKTQKALVKACLNWFTADFFRCSNTTLNEETNYLVISLWLKNLLCKLKTINLIRSKKKKISKSFVFLEIYYMLIYDRLFWVVPFFQTKVRYFGNSVPKMSTTKGIKNQFSFGYTIAKSLYIQIFTEPYYPGKAPLSLYL